MKATHVLTCSRCFAFALCVGLCWAAFSAVPATAAMSDNDFVTLCEKGAPDEVRQALRDGANPNARRTGDDGPEPTALMEAAKNRHIEVIGILLDAGADVNGADSYGGTALMEAASSNSDPEAVKALLAAGAKVNTQSDYGRSALMRATANENPGALTVLLAAGADVNAGAGDGETALMLATSHDDPGPFIKPLLAAGADVNARDEEGETVLMKAASNGSAEAIRILLAAGADPKRKDKNGHDALWHARHADHRFVSQEQTAEVIRALQ